MHSISSPAAFKATDSLKPLPVGLSTNPESRRREESRAARDDAAISYGSWCRESVPDTARLYVRAVRQRHLTAQGIEIAALSAGGGSLAMTTKGTLSTLPCATGSGKPVAVHDSQSGIRPSRRQSSSADMAYGNSHCGSMIVESSVEELLYDCHSATYAFWHAS